MVTCFPIGGCRPYVIRWPCRADHLSGREPRQLRLVEMSQQVIGNLDRIITVLEDETPSDTQVPDAG